jgi:hypothetical protein
VRQGTQKQRLVDLLADHLGEVGEQGIDGPLRHRRNTLGVRAAHGGDQFWCSVRSATA